MYAYVSIRRQVVYNTRGTSVVVCTELSGKELHRHLIRRVNNADIREPIWCNGSTLAWNARDAGLIPTLGTIFPILITPMT